MFFDNYNNNQSNSYTPFGTGTPAVPHAPVQQARPEYAQNVQNVNDNIEEEDDGIEGWDDNLDEFAQKINIKVFGVGGGGNNAVNRMFLSGDKSAEMVVVNTDIPVLRSSPVKHKIAIGKMTTRGHGAGANPESGKRAAEESIDLIKKKLEGVDMLYITAGMGGGTGTGASPVIAKAAKEMDILTVAVVTKPFEFEGESRMAAAEDGINQLRQNVDAVIVVPNERLNALSDKPLPVSEAFKAADDILIKGVQSICSLINDESYINLDFADVTTILKNSGDAHIGVGIASGDNKAMLAAEHAINSPLLETSIKEADGMIISIIADENVALSEITEATNSIRKEAAKNVKIIWGLKFDPNIGDKIEITVIATRSGGLRDYPMNNNAIEEEPVMQNPVVPPVAPNPAPAPQQNARPIPTPAAAPVHNTAPAPQQQPVTVKPQEPKTAVRPDTLLSDLEFKFIQSVATKKFDR